MVTQAERDASIRAAMDERRMEKVSRGELVIVQVDHEVELPKDCFPPHTNLFVTPEMADFLTTNHGAKKVSPRQAAKEVAVAQPPAKAETPEDKSK